MARAQKQGNFWYFGDHAGIDFNEVPAKAVTDGALSTHEGCASISDEQGHLLFYSDGVTVYNRKHQQMKNGMYLRGDFSSTQSAVIVKQPGSSSIYFIFTPAIQGFGDMRFSVVDMRGDGGNGAVVSKNELLYEHTTEKVTAVKHTNGNDIWIISHEFGSDRYLAHLLTNTGLNKVPVVSQVGSYMGYDFNDAIGYMKASPDGSKLAAAAGYQADLLEVSSFDAGTGKVFNPVQITDFRGTGPYGVEFSPDGSLIYVDIFNDFVKQALYQVKLPVSNGTIGQVGTLLLYDFSLGAIQLGPDGKIYIAHGQSGYLHTIEDPNKEGAACRFQYDSFYLGGKTSLYGLPFYSARLYTELSFTAAGHCAGDETKFSLQTNISPISGVAWDFGDGTTVTGVQSVHRNVVHRYKVAGKYRVRLTVYANNASTKYEKEVVVAASPSVHLGDNVTLQYGETLLLDATNPNCSYQWNTGSVAPTYRVSSPGSYSVIVTGAQGCDATGEIVVKYDQPIDINWKNELTLCKGQVVKLDATLPGASYQWSTGSHAAFIDISSPGNYAVTITNAYHSRSRTYTVIVRDSDFGSIHTQQALQFCDPVQLNLTATGATIGQQYQWFTPGGQLLATNNGSFDAGVVKQDTRFLVALTNGFCSGEKLPIDIRFRKPVARIANRDTVIDIGGKVNLKASGGTSYQWFPASYLDNPATANPFSAPLKDITYSVIVTNDQGCSDTASVSIKVRSDLIIANTFTPNADGINDRWVITNIDKVEGNQVDIYSRSGMLVASYSNYLNSWDGTSGGRPLPPGVYYYTIRGRNSPTRSGFVTLIR